MKKNDRITLEITAVSVDGAGIGRYDNTAVFVPSAAVGDVLDVLIVKVLKKFCFGKIMGYIKKSADRCESGCDVFQRCGGCCYRHINYAAERRIKQQRVEDAVRRIGKIDAPILDIVGAEETDRYRNKAQYPVGISQSGEITAGFYSLHSHRIISCDDCKLQPKSFADIVDASLKFFSENGVSVYDGAAHSGLVRHIYIRRAASGETMVCYIINGKRIKNEAELVRQITAVCGDVSGIIINENTEKTNVILGKSCRTIYGRDYIVDTLCGVKVKISPLSFYQVNRDMAQRLYEIAAEYAEPDGKTVLDLYCGAGTIGLSMARRAKKIIGVEIVPQAVEDAKFNADMNGIRNAEFICDTAENAAKILSGQGIAPDVVVLDPPRKGAAESLIHTIAEEFCPERVVYVSCDPGTLARDLGTFDSLGYKTQKVCPVDLFPRTAHVETVCLLSKVNPDK